MKKHTLIVFVFLFCSYLSAQEKEESLSMQDAIDYAIENNYDNKIATNAVKSAIKKSVFVFFLILIASFIVKPLLAMSYDVDVRKKRNLNFFCRQIILTKYDKLFKKTLEIGCQNYTSQVCDLNSKKKDILKLKYRNKWEPECKEIFFWRPVGNFGAPFFSEELECTVTFNPC